MKEVIKMETLKNMLEKLTKLSRECGGTVTSPLQINMKEVKNHGKNSKNLLGR